MPSFDELTAQGAKPSEEQAPARVRYEDLVPKKEGEVKPKEPSFFDLKGGVIQEQHPRITIGDRLLIKNLATSPEVGVAYLKKKYPDLDVRQIQGQTVVRAPGEKDYRVLDPDTGFFSKDILADAGDLAYDALSGLGIGAATGAAGAVGGFPAATVAGAASSAGAEALRQNLGEALGLPSTNVDPSQVKTAGAVGALMGGAEKVGKAAYGVATRKIIPWLGEITSGVPRGVLRDFLENPDRVKQLEQNPNAFLQLVGQTQEDILSGVQNKVSAKGREIGQALDTAHAQGKSVDISEVKNALTSRIASAEKAFNDSPTPASKEMLDDLREVQNQYFKQTIKNGDQEVVQDIPNMVSPRTAFNLKQQLKELANPQAKIGAVSKMKNPAAKEITVFGKDGMNKLSEGISALDDNIPKLNEEYSSLLETQQDIAGAFNTKQGTLNTLKGLDTNSKKVLQARLNQVLEKPQTDKLRDALQSIQTQSYMANPASLPLSGLGTTSTSRSVPLAAALGTLGTLAGYKSGGGYAGAALGGAAGAQFGSMIGSPKTVGLGLKALSKAEELAAKKGVRPSLYGGGYSAWEALQHRQE